MRESGNVTRAFTMFKTVPVQMLNTVRNAYGEWSSANTSSKKSKAGKKFAQTVLAFVLSNVMLEGIEFLNNWWKNNAKNYRDEDNELTLKSAGETLARKTFEDGFKTIIGAGELIDVVNGITGKTSYYTIEAPGVEQVNEIIDTTVNFTKATSKVVNDVKNIGDADLDRYIRENGNSYLGEVKDVANMIAGYFGGVPVSNFEKYLIGTLDKVSPSAAEKYRMLWDSTNKRDLSGLSGERLEQRVNEYMNMRVETTEDTAKEMARLYEATGTEVIPSDVPSKLKLKDTDEGQTTLSIKQKQDYADNYKSVAKDINDLVNASTYKNADDSEKAEMVTFLYSAAKDKAENSVGKDATKNLQRYNAVTSSGVSASDYVSIMYDVKKGKKGITQKDRYKKVKDYGLNDNGSKAVIMTFAESEGIEDRIDQIGGRRFAELMYDTDGMNQEEKVKYIKGKTSDKELQRRYFIACGYEPNGKKDGKVVVDKNFNDKFGYSDKTERKTLAAPGKTSERLSVNQSSKGRLSVNGSTSGNRLSVKGLAAPGK